MFNCSLIEMDQPTLRVNEYTVHTYPELGRGAFGIVYKARDTTGNTVAAKKMDVPQNASEMNSFYNNPPKHANIIKVLDTVFDKDTSIMWMFMHFCEHGDLNRYFARNVESLRDIRSKLNIMQQISDGLSFLHERYVAHRDIKPGNILVTEGDDSTYPRVVISDFNLSKYLDPDDLTSGMTSDVGSLAFRAPEFFNRNLDGKIRYHRNVDTFACGLTFLSMLQYESGPTLFPYLELSSELPAQARETIGFLMFDRERKGQPRIDVATNKTSDCYLTKGIKEVIRQMTHVQPDSRVQMEEVVKMLKNENQLKKMGQIPQMIHLHPDKTYEMTPDIIDVFDICCTEDGEIHCSVTAGLQPKVQCYDIEGNIKATITPPLRCNHAGSTICPLGVKIKAHHHIAMSCYLCCKIYLYDLNQNKYVDTYDCQPDKPYKMCEGGPGEILVLNDKRNINHADSEIKGNAIAIFDVNQPRFHWKKEINLDTLATLLCFYHLPDQGEVVVTFRESSNEERKLKAVNIQNEEIVWAGQPFSENDSKVTNLCADMSGHIFAVDYRNSCINVLDARSGETMQYLKPESLADHALHQALWCENLKKLIVRHQAQNTYISTITYFDILPEQDRSMEITSTSC